jgi:hypothetical protein
MSNLDFWGTRVVVYHSVTKRVIVQKRPLLKFINNIILQR